MNNEESLKILERISKIKFYLEKREKFKDNKLRQNLMLRINTTLEKVIRYLEKS